MHSPKLRPPMSTRQVIRQNNDDTKITATRISLLVWAFFRLAISSLWTGTLVLATAAHLLSPHSREPPSRLFFGAFAIVVQLIEFAMLVTFIVAGFKKSASLYRTYYWYCILSFTIYVLSATLCLALGYDKGHYFGELYLFYHVLDVAGVIGNDELVFFIASIVDVGLEILLICLVKMLINNYRHHGNKYVAGETV